LTTISQRQAGPQSVGMLKNYFDANPQASKDLQQLQQPLATLSTRCKLPLTMPQLMGLMQSAQQGGGLPAGLPGAPATAQTGTAPAAAVPAQRPSTSAISQGNGALPGPAIAGLP
jgi:hypothetical protein